VLVIRNGRRPISFNPRMEAKDLSLRTGKRNQRTPRPPEMLPVNRMNNAIPEGLISFSLLPPSKAHNESN
jgi:hypothetical protein